MASPRVFGCVFSCYDPVLLSDRRFDHSEVDLIGFIKREKERERERGIERGLSHWSAAVNRRRRRRSLHGHVSRSWLDRTPEAGWPTKSAHVLTLISSLVINSILTDFHKYEARLQGPFPALCYIVPACAHFDLAVHDEVCIEAIKKLTT